MYIIYVLSKQLFYYLLQNPLINVVAVDTLHPDALINYEQVARGKMTV